jgi:hypothetical protein
MKNEENLISPEDLPSGLLTAASKGLFNFIQIIGVTIRKSGRRGIFEDHLFTSLTPPPKRDEFDALVAAFIKAGMVRRVEGSRHNVLYWVGPNRKKGAV